MSNQSKKIIEKIHFEYFKERCEGFPSGKIDRDGESPVFIIEYKEGKLGVEHTRLFKEDGHPNALQTIEGFRREIVRHAKELCEKDVSPLLVNVWFTFNQKVPKNRKSEIERIGGNIAELVRRWNKENPSKEYENLKPHLEVSEIFQMFIARSPKHYWSMEGCAVEQKCSIEKLQKCIDEKNARYEKYLERCNECWLLIVVDVFKNSQSLVPNLTHRYESKFKRVFCLDASHRKQLQELYVKWI
ncbi:MAG: hypothetical protein OEV87_02425 [Phycisphaerae bacterium]|nr:hypothetical protein [Phycisphaerae bacterium]